MIARTLFWKKFKKLIFGCFAIFSGFFTCFLLGSWTINEQGNLVGDNLFDLNSITNSWEKNIEENYFVIPNDTLNVITNSTFKPLTTYSIHFYFVLQGDYGNSNLRMRLHYTDNTYIDIPRQVMTIYDVDTTYEYSLNTDNNKTLSYIQAYYGSGSYNCSLKISYLSIIEGSNNFNWEPYGVWYSQNNYDLANDNKNSFYYNTFNGSKSLIYPQGTTWYQQGSISQLYNAYMNEPTTAELPYIYSLNRTDTSFTMKSYPTTQDESDLFDDNPRGTILFIPNTYISYPIYVGLNDITFNYRLQVLYLDNTSLVIDTDNLQPHLYIAKVESSFDNPIIAISYDYYYEDYFLNTNISIDTAGLNINDYYQRGYDSAKSYYGASVQQQLRDIEELNNQINTLNNTIDSWKSRYNDLASQNTELSMRNLMWYIASTPFESFKSIWNVDFLGLNISAFFTGMFSIFIIIWILKKIF